jgi:hypothetical protein
MSGWQSSQVSGPGGRGAGASCGVGRAVAAAASGGAVGAASSGGAAAGFVFAGAPGSSRQDHAATDASAATRATEFHHPRGEPDTAALYRQRGRHRQRVDDERGDRGRESEPGDSGHRPRHARRDGPQCLLERQRELGSGGYVRARFLSIAFGPLARWGDLQRHPPGGIVTRPLEDSTRVTRVAFRVTSGSQPKTIPVRQVFAKSQKKSRSDGGSRARRSPCASIQTPPVSGSGGASRSSGDAAAVCRRKIQYPARR